MLTEHLAHLDYLGEAVERVEVEIEQRLQAVTLEVTLLDSIPGISQNIAHVILAKIGSDLNRFPLSTPSGVMGWLMSWQQ